MMRRLGGPTVLSLLLAAVIHADWHLARPTHHRLSLGWPQHWIFAAIGFAVVGWVIARQWEHGFSIGAAVLALAIIVAQGVEPVLEVVIYQGRFGYASEPERWRVFATCLAVGLPAFVAALFLCRPRRGTPGGVRLADRAPEEVSSVML